MRRGSHIYAEVADIDESDVGGDGEEEEKTQSEVLTCSMPDPGKLRGNFLHLRATTTLFQNVIRRELRRDT